MSTYNGIIQPNLLSVLTKRDISSNQADITSYLITKRGIITRKIKGLKTKDFNIILIKRIPRERVLNKYANRNSY